MKEYERAIWVGIWAKDGQYMLNDIYPYYPTEYAKTSPEEDFADSFARWILEKDKPITHQGAFGRTQNLDPEREEMLELFFKRILDNCENDEVVHCVVGDWREPELRTQARVVVVE